MKKRTSVSVLLVLLSAGIIWSNASQGYLGQPLQSKQNKDSASESSAQIPQLRIKTYTLKHINPEELLKATKFYYEDATFVDNIITIKIWDSKIPEFEHLLNKLDVEKKTVQF
jgi:hypothetical protein